MGEYAQPAWAERSRFSSTTSVYVLSPYEMFVGNIWEADFRQRGKTLHDLTQEIDLGLPHRFELGLENELGLAGSDERDRLAPTTERGGDLAFSRAKFWRPFWLRTKCRPRARCFA
jgi:hypothetical protein